MQVETLGPNRYAHFERLSYFDGLVHAVTLRPLNVAQRPGPDEDQRAAHRAQAVADLGLDPRQLRYCEQVHRTNLDIVTAATPAGLLTGCDGAVTNIVGVPLMSFSADCPLVLLYDPLRRVVAVVHASWRCTVARICQRMVSLMAAEFGCTPPDLRAGIGPGAGPCCYEVQNDVYQAAAAAKLERLDTLFAHRDGRMFFDLWAANRRQLLDAFIPEGQIETAGVCTMCRTDLFYSYRREGPGCGHFGLIAALL